MSSDYPQQSDTVSLKETETVSPDRICYQVNLQQWFGGGEVYTGFFSKALSALGWQSIIFVHKKADFWEKMALPSTRFVPVEGFEEIARHLPSFRSLLVFHTMAHTHQVLDLQKHLLTCFAHMPLYGRNPQIYDPYRVIFTVSQHVKSSIEIAGIHKCYSEPLYGVADLERFPTKETDEISATSAYCWDPRKFRDVVFGHFYPVYNQFLPRRIFEKKKGITLGIVSVIGPIKQFPLLFQYLCPVIKEFPQINIEIFGNGGYASVRDLKQSLAPLKQQVRFWGTQTNLKLVYSQIDYLLTGLPEKEALGLNVIEAQQCGVPVIAVNAPPFTETVTEGKTGFFYTDPREDNGQDFTRLLSEIMGARERLNPLLFPAVLERFSFDSFVKRVEKALAYCSASM